MIAAIYARKSTEQNGVADEQKSVARQIEHSKAYAARKGWRVAEDHIYVDDGISGAEFSNRPGFLRLMNALKPRPTFGVLIMSEESRLGREQLEVGYALKQIIEAGVEVWLYLEDRQRTLDSPIDKMMLSLTAFADELEREKARQRVRDAMVRKANSRHVTGGRVFGYMNVEVLTGHTDAFGRPKRSHVERQINEAEAAVVRRIFKMASEGAGKALIAKTLNAEGAPCPRSQQGRPSGWAPSSVYEALFRPLYRGEIIYGQTAKRDKWGRKRRSDRPPDQWQRVEAPELRIVDEPLWLAAHAKLTKARETYLRSTKGRLWGRPPAGTDAKYLLTGLAECPVCGGTLMAESRSHGRNRAFFYTCGAHRRRGETVCNSHEWIPMKRADEAIVSEFIRKMLQPDVLGESIDRALDRVIAGRAQLQEQRARVAERLEGVETELKRLTDALAAGVGVAAIASALAEREAERQRLKGDLAALDATPVLSREDRAAIVEELSGMLAEWRDLLTGEVTQGRQVLRALLKSRIRFSPEVRNGVPGYRFEAQGSLQPIVAGFVQSVASPTGFEPVFWP